MINLMPHTICTRTHELSIKRLKGIRELEEVSFEDSPVTGIFGPNGIGKSTILQALACAYKPSKREGLDYKAFFPPLDRDFWNGTQFTITHSGKIITDGNPRPTEFANAKLEYRKGTATARWKPAKNKRPERDVVFLGLQSCLPAIERYAVHNLRNATYEPLEGENHKRVLEAAGRILNISYTRWDKVHVPDYPNRNYIALRRDGMLDSNPSVILGAGEQRLLDLLLRVEEADKCALILVDEIDLLLHGDALNRLMDHLVSVCGRKRQQLVFTSHRESLLKLDEKINVRHVHFHADRFYCFPNTDPSSLRRLTGVQERSLEIFVEDNLAETIAQTEASRMGITQHVKINRFGAASNCFTVLAGLLLKSESCEQSLFVLDGDIFLKSEEQMKECRRAIAGDAPDAIRLREKMQNKITQFALPPDTQPELFLHSLLTSLPREELSAADQETWDLATEIVNPEDRHQFIDKIVERLGGNREVTLNRVVHLCSDHSDWASYVKPVTDWLEQKKTELSL